MREDFIKDTEMWSTDMSNEAEIVKALDKFKAMTETGSCPMAVQGYIGVSALMTIERLRGCCSQSVTMEATLFALGMAIANIVGVLPEDRQKEALAQLDAFIYKCVQVRCTIADPRMKNTTVQ